MREKPQNVVLFVAPPEAVSVLRAVLAGLPVGFPAAILILLHKGTGGERPVAHNLNVNSGLLVMPGLDGTALRNDRAYVVRPEQRLALGADGSLTPDFGAHADADAFLLGNDDADLSTASEALLSSLASRYGAGAIAVALTALDNRETEGFRRIHEAGGHTIALDEADRLWADSSGPRVVPGPADELIPAAGIGKRMLAMLAASAL